VGLSVVRGALSRGAKPASEAGAAANRVRSLTGADLKERFSAVRGAGAIRGTMPGRCSRSPRGIGFQAAEHGRRGALAERYKARRR
jgi:hypothetical protein